VHLRPAVQLDTTNPTRGNNDDDNNKNNTVYILSCRRRTRR